MIAFSALCRLHAPMFGIYVMPLLRTTPRRVSPSLSGHCTGPCWSPQTKYLAFTGAQKEFPGQARIYLYDTETFTTRTITAHAANGHAEIWIADEQIAFSSNENNHYYLYTMHIDGTNVRTILDLDVYSYDGGWSQDRRYFIVTPRNMNTQLHLFDALGSHLHQWTSDTRPKYHPLLSPDGLRVAFTSEGEQTAPLYVMHLDGTAMHYVSQVWRDWKYDERYFVWSPDSQKIAYIGVDEQEEWLALYIVNADGAERQQIALLNLGDEIGEIYPCMPVWSPDSKQLLFSSYEDDDQSKLYLTTIDRRVTECIECDQTPFDLISDLTWSDEKYNR